jgi:uncharacterized OB-fold protein
MSGKATYAKYMAGLAEGRFLAVKCDNCEAFTFPPKTVCRSCGGTGLDEADIGASGVIRTFTVIRVPPQGREPNYIVAMAELDDGPWVIGQLEGVDTDHAGLDLIGKKVSLGSKEVPGDVYSDAVRCLTFSITG